MIDESRRNILAPYLDSESLRRPELIRIMPEGRPASDSRVTIGVVSAEFEQQARANCLDLLKKHTRNFDLAFSIIMTARISIIRAKMNRLLEICRTRLWW